ncbi:MAG: type II CAAX prenyl endopeptidase Rce1 family protein [Acidimicrobiia bacterium]
MSSPLPNWYPDPSGAADLRYWDGGEWTRNVVVAGEVTERAMPWPPVTDATEPPDERAHLPGRASLYGLGGFVLGMALALGLSVAGILLDFPEIAVLLLNLGGLWSGLLGACWMASRRYGTGSLRRDYGLRIQGHDLGRGLGMSIAARLAAGIVILPFVAVDERLAGDNSEVFGDVGYSALTFAIFAVVVTLGAPLVEELFFRGLLLRSLTTRFGPIPALLLQAALFALAHFSPTLGLKNVSVMAVIGTAGVVFGITARRWRVGTSVVAHGAFNLISVAALGFATF